MSTATGEMPEELKGLHRRISQWRQTRTQKGPMPEELWLEATRLATEHSVTTVAGHLRLGYKALKDRVEANAEKSVGSAGDCVHFVELLPGQGKTTVTGEPNILEQSIELCDPAGYRLRVQLKASNIETFADCVRQIWNLRACCK